MIRAPSPPRILVADDDAAIRRTLIAELGSGGAWSKDGREIRLTPTEYSILEFLAVHAGKPVTIRQIIGRVWHGAAGTTPDAVRVHVGSLRRKIEPDPSRPRYIITEPWIGYRFVAEPLSGA